MTPPFSFMIQQLAYMAPMLLVCTAGCLVAMVRYGHHPKSSLLVLAGCSVIVMASLAILGFQTYLMGQETGNGIGGRSASLMGLAGMAGTVGRSAGTALLITAAFVGRNQRRDNFDFGGRSPHA